VSTCGDAAGLTVSSDRRENESFVRKQRGKLGANRYVDCIGRQGEVVAAEKEKSGVVDEEEEDGCEEHCDG
jgi:hypothetical protein